ncbi:transposable element Tcb2 transposase [Trichonephila clavipes]|nr:transposable element Tcb2 transposase [Trichonephila clavipes]
MSSQSTSLLPLLVDKKLVHQEIIRRQYKQLSHERGRILGMMEAGWSARRVARQLCHSDCVVKRCWDQWIREISFSRRPGSRRPEQTSLREDRRIVRNARVQPTASSAAIQAQIAPSLGAPVSSRTIRRRLEWCRARANWTAAEWNQVVFSDESRFNISSDDNRVSVWRPRGECLNPAFALQRHTAPTSDVRGRHLHVSKLEGWPTATTREHDLKISPPPHQLAQEDVEARLLLQERQEGHFPGDDHT